MGKSRTQFCFGGQPAIVRELRRRDWPAVLGGSRPTPQPYELAWPERGQLEADTGRLGRAQGCLLGQIAGDALGGLVEFGRPEGIRAQYPDCVRLLEDGGHWNTLAGQPTDDSELALMLARSIIASGQYDAEAAAQAYVYWYRSHPFDCGATIGQALGAVSRDDVTARRTAAVARANASTTSRSNGSLMRVSPLGIWGHQLSPDRLAGHAPDDAAITHGDPLCGDAGAVFVVAIARAMAAGGAPRDVYEFARAWAARADVHGDVLGALERASSEPPRDFLTQPGWILIAFQNAFFRLLHAPSLEEGDTPWLPVGEFGLLISVQAQPSSGASLEYSVQCTLLDPDPSLSTFDEHALSPLGLAGAENLTSGVSGVLNAPAGAIRCAVTGYTSGSLSLLVRALD